MERMKNLINHPWFYRGGTFLLILVGMILMPFKPPFGFIFLTLGAHYTLKRYIKSFKTVNSK